MEARLSRPGHGRPNTVATLTSAQWPAARCTGQHYRGKTVGSASTKTARQHVLIAARCPGGILPRANKSAHQDRAAKQSQNGYRRLHAAVLLAPIRQRPATSPYRICLGS
jgi:hypothetical protein